MKFQWDDYNLSKIKLKHSVSRSEAESVFKDTDKKVFFSRMVKEEMRYICIGIGKSNKLRVAVYTIRQQSIRIISCRYANKSEKKKQYTLP